LIPTVAIDRHSLALRNMVYDLIVAGGGAAGFYAAIQAAELRTAGTILIVEKSPKLLAKVRVSGGGRCNITHSCFVAKQLASHYPRGQKPLTSVFRQYQAKDVVTWFAGKGVALKTEDDGRMFPITDDSQTIIDCFMREALKLKIQIELSDGIQKASYQNGKFEVVTQKGLIYQSHNFLIAVGGSPSRSAYQWIEDLGHPIVSPIPSLFTFNDSEKDFKDLMGISVDNAVVKIAGTKLENLGPLLITHWGLSGPAVIKLSAWAAAYLHEINYTFTALVSWIGEPNEDEVRAYLNNYKLTKGKQKVLTNPLYALPQRLWTKLCQNAEIPEEKIWSELPQKSINKLLENLIRCPFKIKGKTTFKDEFVTCGGVDLAHIDIERMESKKVPGLFFAGEVLNIDGETGGFNFQAAWSTGFVVAKSLRRH
jgi:predicted Rossmann fold flavoprotein